MADNKSSQAIIIKKIKKGGHAAHGGAWKIAYADFVTAMMAFFLLLWLLSAVSQEQLEGISNYFAPVSVSSTMSGGGDILGGATIAVEGSAQTSTSRDSVTVELPPPRAGTGGEGESGSEEANPPTEEEALEEKMRQQEEDDFEKAKKELEEIIAEVPELNELADSLLIDNTPEGLRIQLVDKDGLSMFPSGSAIMHAHTQRILSLVAKVIAKMPQQISISGHTDSVAFVTDNGYSNWELSADRANAARRALVDGAVPFERISRVIGKAATEPFLPDDTKNAKNRRLSIIMLRGTGKDNPANIEEMRKKRKLAKAKKKKKKAGEEETLPGLEAIRKRQSVEGAGKVKEEPPAPAIDPFAKAKPKPKKPEKLKLEPKEGAAPVLPGLEGIRQRQVREGLKKEAPPQKTPDINLKGLENKKGLESIEPIIRLKKKIERTEGEALPGLGAIRQRQVREGLKKEAPPQKTPDINLIGLENKKDLESIEPIIRLKKKIEGTEGEALPGLGAIRKRQVREGLKKGAPVQNAPDTLKGLENKQGLESTQPIIRLKKKIERTEGEALPGLGAIRKRQLEEELKK